MNPITKICTKCKKEKPATKEYFHGKKDTKDGLCLQCKECIAEKSKLYYRKNQQKRKAYNKKYYEENQETLTKNKRDFRKENLERVKAQEARSRENNKQAITERKKKYYAENKDRILSYLKDYREDPSNKERAKQYNKHYSRINRKRLRFLDRFKIKRLQSIKAGLAATFTPAEWKSCIEYFNNSCAYCGKQNTLLEQDHFIAMASGGGYEESNIVPACVSCNRKKGNRDFFEWYNQQPFYCTNRERKIIYYIHSNTEGCEHGHNKEGCS